MNEMNQNSENPVGEMNQNEPMNQSSEKPVSKMNQNEPNEPK